jgi:hypothetical protein
MSRIQQDLFFQEMPCGPAGTRYQVVTLPTADTDIWTSLYTADIRPKNGCWVTIFNSTAATIFFAFAPKGGTAVAVTAANSIPILPSGSRRMWVLPSSLHGKFASTAVGLFMYVSSPDAGPGPSMAGTNPT